MQKGKVLAIDYGSKRIGVASGDLEFKIAFPRDVLENKGDIVGLLKALCDELEVVLLVVGLPLSMQESQASNPLLKEVNKFVERLKKFVEVELVDERLSSFEAREKMDGARQVDAQAAQVILQRYFDAS